MVVAGERPRVMPPEGYEAIAALAEGGMGELVVARRRAPGGVQKLVVLKQVRPSYAADPEFEAMFLREAKIAASLDHINVVQVLDSGVDPHGRVFMAMEYVHGVDLRALMRRLGGSTPLARTHALTIAVGLADGLGYVHGREHDDGRPLGLVHRDVSPANVLLSYDGAVKLTDFGVAGASADSLATRSGAVKGKLAYMAPEQARGDAVDARADLYSLGVVLYEMTTGQRPFAGLADAPLLYRKLEADPEDPRALIPGYPDRLAEIVRRAMARDPADRYEDASQFRRDLEDFAATDGGVLSPGRLGEYVVATCGRRPLPTALHAPRTGAADREATPAADLDKVQSVLTGPRPPRRRLWWVAALGVGAVAAALALAPGWMESTASSDAGPPIPPAPTDSASMAPSPDGSGSVDAPVADAPRQAAEARVEAPPSDPAARDSPPSNASAEAPAAPAGDGGSASAADPAAEPEPPPTKARRSSAARRGRRRDRDKKSPPPAKIDSPLPFGGS